MAEKEAGAAHRPVMVEEVLEYLRPTKGQVIVDGTLGTGGHAEAVLERIGPGGRLIGIDRDPEAIAQARQRLGKMAPSVGYHRENYRDIQSVLQREGIEAIDGLLLDLGLSSLQVNDPARGFSFRKDGPLDMRMGPDAERTAAEILNEETETQLARILFEYGEERWARRIAHFIIEARERRPISTTAELVGIVKDAVPAGARRGRKHPARKTFQALRIAVNHELEDLKEGMTRGIECLVVAGRIVVLTYQSLEDRMVKSTFSSLAQGTCSPPGVPPALAMPVGNDWSGGAVSPGEGPLLRVLTKKPVTPGEAEIEENPRARSAKLRAAERID